AISDGLIDEDRGDQGFQVKRLDVLPTGSVASDLLSGDASPRTQQYESRLSTTFRPKLDKIGVLDWISLQDGNYSAVFAWRNGGLQRRPAHRNNDAPGRVLAEVWLLPRAGKAATRIRCGQTARAAATTARARRAQTTPRGRTRVAAAAGSRRNGTGSPGATG